jgi:hypothetical protein
MPACDDTDHRPPCAIIRSSGFPKAPKEYPLLYESLLITDEDVDVDGKTFKNCRFVGSRIIYEGGEVPKFTNCIFERCQWVFDGPAENTIQYFALLYNGLGPGGHELIEGIFDSIRRGGVGHGTLLPTPALR